MKSYKVMVPVIALLFTSSFVFGQESRLGLAYNILSGKDRSFVDKEYCVSVLYGYDRSKKKKDHLAIETGITFHRIHYSFPMAEEYTTWQSANGQSNKYAAESSYSAFEIPTTFIYEFSLVKSKVVNLTAGPALSLITVVYAGVTSNWYKVNPDNSITWIDQPEKYRYNLEIRPAAGLHVLLKYKINENQFFINPELYLVERGNYGNDTYRVVIGLGYVFPGH